MDLNYVFINLVHKNHTFGNVKNIFKRNVFPVSLDGIQYGGVTKPLLVAARVSGRPRTRRRIKDEASFWPQRIQRSFVQIVAAVRGHN